MNTREDLSLRQVLAAVAVAGLSMAAAQAGQVDWKWGLLGVAVAVPVVSWIVLRRQRCLVYQGVWGGVLAAVYAGWSTLTLGHILGQAAQRVETTGGSQGVRGWLIVLLAVPVVWMSWGKPAAFFRGGEIHWMVMVAVLVAVGLLTLPHITVSYLWMERETGWQSAVSAAGCVATAVWVLPYLYQVEPEHSGARWAVARWLLLLGGLSVALAAVTQGILGQASGEMAHPFFITTGVMGNSARTEGLLSALWLVCDLVWAGLLTRVWGGGRGPVIGAVLGLGIALSGWTEGWSALVWPLGNLALATLAAISPSQEGKIVLKF